MKPFFEWSPLLGNPGDPPQFILLGLFGALIAYHHLFCNRLLDRSETTPTITAIIRLLNLGALLFYFASGVMIIRIAVFSVLQDIGVIPTIWLTLTDYVMMALLVVGFIIMCVTALKSYTEL